MVVWQEEKDKKPSSIHGTTFSTKNQAWSSSALLSPKGKHGLLAGCVLGSDREGFWLGFYKMIV